MQAKIALKKAILKKNIHSQIGQLPHLTLTNFEADLDDEVEELLIN